MKNSIKVERAIQNLTQSDLAKAVGVSRQTINSLESNKYIPSTILSLKISNIFNKKVNDMFFLDDDD